MKLNKEIREFKAEEYLWMRPGEDAWLELDVDTLPDRDGDVFIRAKIDQIDMDKRVVICTYEDPDFTGSNEVHITRIMKRDPKSHPELADLVDMPVLNDAELHQKIRDRFARLEIFTYIGPSLLIINPFKYLKDQYKESLKKEFYDCIMHPGTNKVREKPPHVWAIAAYSYLELYNNKMNQAVCISGESGAGKTVNTKTCMSFLTGMNEIFGSGKSSGSTEPPIEDKILMCNPILEALGNAKTVRNDNSSRFGKYVSLFMANKVVIGASVDAYLLEAIRVTTPNKSERNYHVFYQFLKGASDADIALMSLVRKPFNYTFLEKSGCSEVPTVDDIAEYNDHEKSMTTLNLKGDWREGYWRIIASVLHLSNIRYDDSNYNGSNACEVTSTSVLEDVMRTLMVEKQPLLDALTCRTSVVMGKEIVIYLDKAGCGSQCEAFGKDIYSKLFTWVIKYLNLALLPAAEKASGQDPAKIYQKIGLLDIFGFEIFEVNSIEQLCINFTNEKLHQLYVEYVFKLEVQTFVDEGLKQFLANLSFKDNQEVLELLAHPDTKRYSVFNLIDDQSATMSKDLNLIDQFQQFHGKNVKMMFSKTKRNMFYIVHTARAVGYTIDGFCEKNKDEVPRPVIRCVLSSKQQRIVDIYGQKIKDGDSAIDYLGEAIKKKESFIGFKFRLQMDALMAELRSCQCSFMRCIKPNEAKSATIWTSSLVVMQIRYLGLLDSIKIRKESYPFRFQFKQFVHKYLELEPTYSSLTPLELDELRPDYKQLSANIIAKGIPEHTDKTQLIGKTRVFLKIEAYQHLEEAYEKAVKVKKEAVKALDKVLLEMKLLETIKNLRKRGQIAVDIINQMIFGMKTKKSHRNFKLIRKVAMKLQANFRSQKALREFRKKKQVLSNIQCAIEAFVAQRKAREKITSAKTIHRYYKNYKLVSSIRWYVELLRTIRDLIGKVVNISDNKTRGKAATTVQKHIRGFLTRRENAEEVKKVKIAKQLFKYNKAMKILKKYIAGKIARRRIRKVMTGAAKIQAYFKMRWTKRAYNNMKKKALIIQRAVRTWLDKKRKKDRKRIQYLKNEYIPFLRKCCTDQSRLFSVKPEDVKRQLGKETPEDYEEPKVHPVFNQIPEVDQSCLPRVRLYTEVFDLEYVKDVLGLYQGSWAKGYIDSLKDSKKIKTDARVIEVGSRHTLLATINGRCYCWGTNDYLQLGTESTEETMAVFRVLKGEEKLRYIAAGDEHTHILTRDRSLFSFGRNDKGQLGLGHTDHVNRIELSTLLTKTKLKSVHSKKQESYAVAEEGELLFWPINPSDCRVGILRLPLQEKANIVSLGSDFAMVLADSGNLYSFGRENRQGQLGLGNLEPCLQPTHVNSLDKERVVQVSCGHSHTLALTRNAKIYAWGAGRFGQLGTGEQTYSTTPLLVKMPTSPSKPLQVCSSIFGSFALYEDGAVYWWGKNSRLGLLKKPTLFRNLENQDLFPIQIRSSWSENLSISYFEVADFRYVKDLNTSQKHAQAKLMANKWNTMSHSQFELPVSNGYGTYLTAKNIESSAAQDLQRSKPDPLSSVPVFNAIFMSDKDFRSPTKPIMRLTTTPGKPPISPGKQLPTKPSPIVNSSVFHRSPATPNHGKQTTSSQFLFPTQQKPGNSAAELPKSFEKVSLLLSPDHRSDKRHERDKKAKEGIQVSQYVSSTRRDQEKTNTQKIEEMLKHPTRKPTSSGLNPHQVYTTEELLQIKKTMKSLMLKPRKNWSQKESEYFQSVKLPEIQAQLSVLK